ncbi:MAG TPA: hypothetical protein VG820_07485, partial [Fimbriimonadaceae bacterium]|nr:hypothetical protein [Fimbriimonadaceae bacterium]
EQWSVQKGRLHRDWTRRPATAFNRFVDLVELLKAGHVHAARAYCASQAIYERIKSLRDGLTSNASVAFKGDFCSTDGVDFGLEGVCMLHWIRRNGRWVIGSLSSELGSATGRAGQSCAGSPHSIIVVERYLF